MRVTKLLGLAFMVTLAFGAFSAGSASALLFLTFSAQESFTSLSLNSLGNQVVIETKNSKLECGSALVHGGLILNKTDIMHGFLLTFHQCEAPGMTCSSAGEPNGLITTSELDGLLVSTLNGKYGILMLASKGNFAQYHCGGFEVVIRGNLVGEFTETSEESEIPKSEAKLEFAKGTNAGEPKVKDYETLSGLPTAARLELSFSGTFEEADIRMTLDLMPLHPIKFCHK